MIFEPFNPLLKRHADYFQSMPCQLCNDTRGFMAVDKNLKVMGAVIFEQFTPNAAQATIQITNPMCLRPDGLITEAAYFIYDICGRSTIFAMVRESNVKALKVNYKLGYKFECKIKGGFYEDEDLIMLRMDKEDCKLYNPALIKEAA